MLWNRITTVKHTSELSKKEMSIFMDKVQLHAAGIGHRLPLPGEWGWDDFYLEFKDEWKYVR